MGRRIRWLGLILILCFTLVLVQLVNLQYRQANALSNDPHNPRNATKIFDNLRGDIFAADGTTVLAYSKPTNGPADTYQYQRVYPEPTASLYSPVTGYASIDYGESGIELQYNQYLQAHPQSAKTLSELLSPPPPTVDNVRLTIEPALQQAAATALGGRDGAVVAIQPTTGAVLALYSNPTYDPNGYASLDGHTQFEAALAANTADAEGFKPIDTLATQHGFAPGSTMKVVTASALLDYLPKQANYSVPSTACAVLPDTDKCLMNDGGSACGGTIAQMIPPSCDPGFGLLGLHIFEANKNYLTDQAEQFGYNQVPPLDLPDVIASSYPTPDQLLPNLPFVAYSAIGQGNVLTTCLQNALVAAGIANGGVVMIPHLLADVHDSQGNLVKAFEPTPWMRATTLKTAQTITPLMEDVAKSGTAAGYLNLALDPAVKTGTAQIGPTYTQTHDWMIGFAPAHNPQIAIAVVVPYQTKSDYGAEYAGPIMNAMMSAAVGKQLGQPTYASGAPYTQAQ